MWGGDHDCDVESYSRTGIAADEGEDVDCMYDRLQHGHRPLLPQM